MDTDEKTTVHIFARIVKFYPCGSVFIRGSMTLAFIRRFYMHRTCYK
jgi:hypothetical protein